MPNTCAAIICEQVQDSNYGTFSCVENASLKCKHCRMDLCDRCLQQGECYANGKHEVEA